MALWGQFTDEKAAVVRAERHARGPLRGDRAWSGAGVCVGSPGLTGPPVSLPVLARPIGCRPLDTARAPARCAFAMLAASGVLLCPGLCSVILRGHSKGSLCHGAPLDSLLPPSSWSRPGPLILSRLARSLCFMSVLLRLALHLGRVFPQLCCLSVSASKAGTGVCLRVCSPAAPPRTGSGLRRTGTPREPVRLNLVQAVPLGNEPAVTTGSV